MDDAGKGRSAGGRRRRPARALLGSLGLLGASLALVLGAFEVGFRLAGYSAIHDVYSKPSLFWQRDELLGWSLVPGAEGSYVGPRPFPVEYRAPVRVNSLGLRGPEVAEREPGEYRVLVLGDSVVAGLEVAYEDTFVARLERRMRRKLGVPVRVINAGVRGYGTDQSYLYYRERGRRLRADLVILVHSANDPNDNVTLHRMRRPFGKPAFAPGRGGSLELVGHPIPDYPICSAWMLDGAFAPTRTDGPFTRTLCFVQVHGADRSALFSFVAQALARLPSLVVWLKDLTYPRSQREVVRRAPPPAAAPPMRASVLGLAARGSGSAAVSAGAGSPAYVVTTALVRALARAVEREGADFLVIIKPEDLSQLDAASLRAEGVDLRSIFAPPTVLPRMLHFRNDGHYNERGHEVFAWALTPLVEAYHRAHRAAREPAARERRPAG